jgi:predicted metal-dependent phosphoesterase TrpH
MRQLLLQALCILSASASLTTATAADTNRWWKGNLHTHTLWSDGDDYPEMVVDWYKEHGYNFLAISDHNVMLEGERWINAKTNKGGSVALAKCITRFGTNWVTRRTNGEDLDEVRLKTLEEIRPRFEEPGKFLMIPGEEISDKYESAPIHLCASNLRELIKPRGGKSIADAIQNNINAVLEQRRRTGQAMIPHVNHPNFEWALTAEDMVSVRNERIFEVHNGHSGVRNYGDKNHASTERIWDILLTRRLAELGLEALWGTAVDDSHGYHQWGVGKVNPGRGWIMVRAAELNAAEIIEAMEQGDFYASTGVKLRNVERSAKLLRIEIEPEADVTYTTQFIGTRKGYNPKSEPVLDANGKELRVTRRYSADIGAVLAAVNGNTPSYTCKGDEIYVRAKVISSKKKENPYAEGDFETAWVQPIVTGVK